MQNETGLFAFQALSILSITVKLSVFFGRFILAIAKISKFVVGKCPSLQLLECHAYSNPEAVVEVRIVRVLDPIRLVYWTIFFDLHFWRFMFLYAIEFGRIVAKYLYINIHQRVEYLTWIIFIFKIE